MKWDNVVDLAINSTNQLLALSFSGSSVCNWLVELDVLFNLYIFYSIIQRVVPFSDFARKEKKIPSVNNSISFKATADVFF